MIVVGLALVAAVVMMTDVIVDAPENWIMLVSGSIAWTLYAQQLWQYKSLEKYYE